MIENYMTSPKLKMALQGENAQDSWKNQNAIFLVKWSWYHYLLHHPDPLCINRSIRIQDEGVHIWCINMQFVTMETGADDSQAWIPRYCLLRQECTIVINDHPMPVIEKMC